MNWSRIVEHWLQDPPRLFDVVFTREARGIPMNRVAQQLLISGQPGRIRMLGCEQFDRLSRHLVPGFFYLSPDRDDQIRRDAESHIVGDRGVL